MLECFSIFLPLKAHEQKVNVIMALMFLATSFSQKHKPKLMLSSNMDVERWEIPSLRTSSRNLKNMVPLHEEIGSVMERENRQSSLRIALTQISMRMSLIGWSSSSLLQNLRRSKPFLNSYSLASSMHGPI